MRTVFVLGRKTDDEFEILYSFGIKRPSRTEVAKVVKDYPKANVFASYPDEETDLRQTYKILHDLKVSR